MMRKAFPLLLVVSVILSSFSDCRCQSATSSLNFTCNPYLQNLNENGITIMWMVNNNVTSWVEYGKSDRLGSKAIHTQSGMADVNPGIQKVVLSDLEPGTKYFYRAVSHEVKVHQPYKVIYGDTLFSPTYSFSTPSLSTTQFSFLAFNDLHSKPQFVEGVVRRESGFNFAILNGDILGDINSEEDILKYLLLPFSNYFATGKPFFMIRGNHETRGAGSRSLSKYVDTPTGKYYYSFTYGNTRFIILDCGEDKPDDNQFYYGLADYDNYRSDEAQWLALEVEKPAFKNAAFKIVCIHMPVTLQPPPDGTSVHGVVDCSQKFAPILNKARVDLLLAGHTHKFTVIRPQKGITNFPIIVGGGPVNGKDNEKTTYTLVEVSKTGLNCFLKKINGDVIEEVKIKKHK